MFTVAVAWPAVAAPIAIEGRIVDSKRQPVAEATVRLVPAFDRYAFAREQLDEVGLPGTPPGRPPAAVAEVKSDRQGRFSLEAPDAGLWRVWVDAEGSVPLEARLEALVEDLELPVAELTPAVDVEVRVRGDDGLLVGARVSAVGQGLRPSFWGARRWQGRTDAEGRARIPAESEGRLALGVFHPGYLPARRETDGRAVGVRLERGRPRTIEVRDGRGRPATGVVARVAEGLFAAGVTAAEGRLALAGPPPGKPPLAFDLLGPPAAGRLLGLRLPSTAEESLEPPRFELTPPISITGRVIDASREPLAGALVWVASRPETLARTDPTGGVELLSASESRLVLSAAAAGYLPATVRVTTSASGEPTVADLILTPSAKLRGRTVDERGDPVAGVEIDVLARQSPRSIRYGRRRARFDRHTARSDGDGRFRIRSLVPEMPYDLTATLPGHARSRQSFVAPAARQIGEVEVVLRQGRRGEGLVVDTQDRPIAAASIVLERQEETDPRRRFLRDWLGTGPDHRAESDAEGRFRIPDLAAGRFQLTVRRSGFAAAVVPGIEVPVGAGGFDLGTVVLSPGADIEGRVVDADGQPLAEAEVFANSREDRLAGAPARAVSGADGRFVIADRRAGAKVDLSATRTGYLSATLSGVEAPTGEPVVLTLRPATRVGGRVVDPGGTPIAGASLMLWTQAGFGGGDGRSDDQGRFVIEGVGPGAGKLHAQAAGWQSLSDLAIEVPPDGIDDLEVVLRRGSAAVAGTVLDPQGAPAIDAHVSLRSQVAKSSGSATTGGDGSFRIDGLDPGSGRILVFHPKYPTLSEALEVEPGVTRVELQLAAGVEVSGQVIGGDGGPVAGATVFLGGHGPAAGRQAVTGGDGNFELVGLDDGAYTLGADHPDYAPLRMPDEVVVAGQPIRGLILELDPGAVLTGRLLGVEFDELPALVVRAAAGHDKRTGEVDFEARYRIPRVGPGRWRVEATAANGLRGQRTVTVARGERAVSLDLELSRGFTLSGRILAGGQPVTDVSLTLAGTDVAVRSSGRSDYLGHYRISGLEAGSYRLTAHLKGVGWSLFRQLRLAGDETLDLEVELTRVAGRLVDAVDRAPIAGARLSVEPVWDDGGVVGSRHRGRGESDAEGHFDLGELAAGRWRLSAVRDGYAPAEVMLDVFAGEDRSDLELALSPTAGLWLTVDHGLVPELTHVSAAVVDGEGRPVATGSYEIEPEGRVHLASVPAGRWRLVVGARGMATLSLPVDAPDDRPRIALERGSRLTVTVPDLALDKVMAHSEIRDAGGRRFFALSWNGIRSSFPLRFGEATVQGLAAGTWTATVTTADERSWTATVSVPPAGDVSVVLE